MSAVHEVWISLFIIAAPCLCIRVRNAALSHPQHAPYISLQSFLSLQTCSASLTQGVHHQPQACRFYDWWVYFFFSPSLLQRRSWSHFKIGLFLGEFSWGKKLLIDWFYLTLYNLIITLVLWEHFSRHYPGRAACRHGSQAHQTPQFVFLYHAILEEIHRVFLEDPEFSSYMNILQVCKDRI